VSGETFSVRILNAAQFEEAQKIIRDMVEPSAATLISGGRSEYVMNAGGQLISLQMTPQALAERRSDAVARSIEIIRNRIDELGTNEPTIQRQGLDRVIVQVPGLDDPQRLIDLIGKTAKMSFHLVDQSVSMQEAMNGRIPPGSQLLPYQDDDSQMVLIRRRVMVSGDDLVDAQAGVGQQSSRWEVNFRFNSSGARRFGDVTRQNVGRPFAIVLDGRVITAPVIQSPIMGGSGVITGNFTVQSANDLAILLRAGALPAPLTVMEQRTVGAELGADSVAAGGIAAMIGVTAVVVFILLSYGLFGVFANVALLLNLILIAGVLSMLQATLTLPGIAGIVLTVGMAVDANVLIYERIREEVATGKTPINAVEAGYTKAMGTIMDANITTFIAALILFNLGAGPVRGFAVTLGIGIITSVFTAFVVTRLMVSLWIRSQRPKLLPI
jgi:protein-export membrane protein SecD